MDSFISPRKVRETDKVKGTLSLLKICAKGGGRGEALFYFPSLNAEEEKKKKKKKKKRSLN